MPRPDEGVTLSDKSPGSTERQKTNAFVTGACTEEVADDGRPTSVADKADDGDGSEEREGVLGNPLPTENAEELEKDDLIESGSLKITGHTTIQKYLRFLWLSRPPKCKLWRRLTTEMYVG